MLQIQDIYDAFADFKRDVSDVDSATFFRWVRFTATYIYDKVKRIDPNRYAKTQLYAVTADPQTSNLPTDFKDINQAGCGLFYYDTSLAKVTDIQLGMTRYGSSEEGYYLSGASVVFTGITTKSYYMRYIPKMTPATALADYFTIDKLITGAPIVDDEDLDSLVKGLDVLYEQWDVNPNSEMLAGQRFSTALDDIFDGFNRSPQVAVMDNPANDF